MARNLLNRLVYKNELLAKLPPYEMRRIAKHLKLIEVTKNQILYSMGERIKYIYFPEDSLISLVAKTSRARFLEISATGFNGAVGIPAVLSAHKTPFRAVVQLPGKIWQVKLSALKAEFDRCTVLHDLMLRYLQGVVTQFAQSIICNRFHKIEERFSRCLLACRREVKKNELELTHEDLAMMLGVPRTLITMTAGKLERAGTIENQRGRIIIVNEKKLEDVACECHKIVQKEFKALLGKG